MRNYQSNRGRTHDRDLRDPDTDHYIPNYDRDGYMPGPRYGNKPEIQSTPPFGYPVLEMVNPQLMNSNWNGSVGRFTIDPLQLDYLVSFKQFYEYTKRTASRRIDDDDMQKRYANYKEKFAARQLAQFFIANKDKEWFQEKYHPTLSIPRYEDIKLRRKRYLRQFLDELQKGEYDAVQYDQSSQTSVGAPNTLITEDPSDEPDVGDLSNEAVLNDNDGNIEYEPQLVIKTVPPTISREKILEMCRAVDGFDYLSLSEPGPNKKFHRIGWIKFKEGTDMKKVFDQLDNKKVDDFIFHFAMNRKNITQTRTPRIALDISNTKERLRKDLEQAKELSLALEAILGEDIKGLKAVESRAQKVIEEHERQMSSKKEEGEETLSNDDEVLDRWNIKKRLDMIITYLRHVHMYCYYCGLECDSAEELSRKCSEPHYRALLQRRQEEPVDSKTAAKTERGIAQWVRNLDQKISMKVHTPDDRELKKLGGRIMQAEIDEFIKEHVLKEHESKYKCQVGECSKAFKGFDYVEKHIVTKHAEEIERIKLEVEYYNNYVCDPNHLLPNTNNPNHAIISPINAVPFSNQPQPFMMANNIRNPIQGLNSVQAAVAGTPWDQIPRIGFGGENIPGWNNALNAARRTRLPAGGVMGMDLDDSLPKDPRQVKSYVDLDAPAEGDSNISFY
ncbi:hypothetical protein BDB01DRAFT_791017 [Pilobolus umbonatus]|nr:hypothetical protein BDB01DRAFT_791017 [Pilobolus umbonatus]